MKLVTRHAHDRRMIKDCNRNYSHFAFDSDSVVLDLGANIGGLLGVIGDTRIKMYVGVEADADNHRILSENASLSENSYHIIHSAATTSTDETITFYRSEDEIGSTNGQANPSSRQKASRTFEQVVPNLNIDALIDQFKPTHLKMDIKGTEMYWFEANGGVIPDCVREMFVEVYTKKGAERFDAVFYPRIAEDFEQVFCFPTEKFKGMGDWYDLPNIGLPNQNAQLYDLNLLMRRKS